MRDWCDYYLAIKSFTSSTILTATLRLQYCLYTCDALKYYVKAQKTEWFWHNFIFFRIKENMFDFTCIIDLLFVLADSFRTVQYLIQGSMDFCFAIHDLWC